MNNKIYALFTDEIVCPYCGYEVSDSWECPDEDDEMYCDNCGKEFSYVRNIEVIYVRNIEVTYSSYKLD